jgi:hypothetical protein
MEFSIKSILLMLAFFGFYDLLIIKRTLIISNANRKLCRAQSA